MGVFGVGLEGGTLAGDLAAVDAARRLRHVDQPQQFGRRLRHLSIFSIFHIYLLCFNIHNSIKNTLEPLTILSLSAKE